MRDTNDLRAWYRENIANMLRAVAVAAYGLPADEQAGFNRAVVAMCCAFGIDPLEIVSNGQVHDQKRAA